MPSARSLLVLCLLSVYVIWGSTYLGMRIAMETIPPLLMGGTRFTLAGAILYTALRLGGAPSPTAREWWAAGRVGVLLLAGGNGFVALGQRYTGSGVAAIIVATMPLFMAVFGTLRGERPTRAEWAGLSIGFLGLLLMRLGGDLHIASAGAILIVLLAPVSWAAGSLWSKTLPMPSGAMASAAQMLVGGPVMLGLGLLRGERLAAMPSLRSLVAVAYLVMFGSLVAFSAYGWLLRNTRPAVATSYAYVNPLVAVGLGVVFGGEQVAASTVGAMGVILVGVAVLSRGKRATPEKGAAAAEA